MQRVEEAVVREDNALSQCPERAEMLEALRAEFPSVDITSR